MSAALDSYDAVHRGWATWIVQSSRFIGELYEWQTYAGSDPEKCRREAYDRCHRVWDYDVEEMIRRAKDDFASRIRSE